MILINFCIRRKNMSKNIKNIINSISEIIKIDSSEGIPGHNAPFGKGPRAALDFFLELAASFGFETKDYDGYAGEVVYGTGDEFAVLVHLDVVPAGDGWKHEPFGGEIDEVNKRVWGRGAMDDKGPAIIALYALKELKDSGFKPAKKIKLIAGCNEESGWGCIDYYTAHAHMPETGFSPDADFPVIYAEKGIMHVKFNFPAEGDYSSLKGGGAVNMVCSYCEAECAENRDRLNALNLTYSGGKVISYGKSAHGSTPWEGVNAIAPVLKYLGLDSIEKLLFKDKFGLDLQDETGVVTLSPNVIDGGKNAVFVTCDIRYPATFSQNDVLKAIDAYGVQYEILHSQAPLYNDKNCNLIKTLCGVYNEVTGKNIQPVAIGGGTYARALKCGAAFGPEEAGEECTVHQPDEYITFEKIERCLKIYKLAIERLTGK